MELSEILLELTLVIIGIVTLLRIMAESFSRRWIVSTTQIEERRTSCVNASRLSPLSPSRC